MRRRLFTVASGLSLLLLVLVAVLWVRSCFQEPGTCEMLVVGTASEASKTFYGTQLISYRGRMEVSAHWMKLADDEMFRRYRGFMFHGIRHVSVFPLTIDGPAPSITPAWQAFGATCARTDDLPSRQTGARINLTFPYWAAFLVLCLIPATWLRHHLRPLRLRRLGTCSHCGYNLAGNDSGVCPECGTPIDSLAAHRCDE